MATSILRRLFLPHWALSSSYFWPPGFELADCSNAKTIHHLFQYRETTRSLFDRESIIGVWYEQLSVISMPVMDERA